MRVSVAIPVYNEEAVLPLLLERLRPVLDALPGGPHEVVFVDDGSRDRSLAILEAAAAADPRVVVVALSRNFGHQAALTAALDHVAGDAIVLMDADLQDPPEAIPRLLAEHAQGFDVVYVRRGRREGGWLLRSAYYLYYRLLQRLAHVTLPADAGDFGLLSRRVVDELRALPEHHRYLRGLRAWVGHRQSGILLDRPARAAGQSKYSLRRLLRLGFDGIFAFSAVPLRAAAYVGLGAIGLSSLFALYAVVVKLLHGRTPEGFTALTLLITFLAGMNLLFLGVIGEYVGRIYDEVKGRPHYLVGRIIRADGRSP